MRIPQISLTLSIAAILALLGNSPPIEGSKYTLPTRFGGRSDEAPQPPRSTTLALNDAQVLKAVLAKIGAGHCVRSALAYPPFTNLRLLIAESSAGQAKTRKGRAAIVRATMGTWSGDSGRVNPALVARLGAAAVAIVERAEGTPLPRDGDRLARPQLPPSWLADGQSMGERFGCTTATVSEVAQEGPLAFVDVGIVHGPLAGSGERWALEVANGEWRVIATQLLWVS